MLKLLNIKFCYLTIIINDFFFGKLEIRKFLIIRGYNFKPVVFVFFMDLPFIGKQLNLHNFIMIDSKSFKLI